MTDDTNQPPIPSPKGNDEYKVGYKNPPLETRIKPGEVRNPNGSRSAGAVVTDWYNAMAKYSRTELEAIIGDKDATAAQVSAAQQWLGAMDAKLPSLVEVCDRTNGQSTKNVKTESRVERVKRIVVPPPSEN